jgi:hypothetical protein
LIILTVEDSLTQRFLVFIDRNPQGWAIALNPKDRIIKTKLVKKSFERVLEACKKTKI